MNRGLKIAIIIPYFGKLPELAAYYFGSCTLNSQIDFLFFTDQPKPADLPKNVRYIKFSLKQFNALSEKETHVKTKIKHPYKLCDYKPLYGHIFRTYLRNYDWWGYTDLDMIFSDFDSFLTEEDFTEFDIITARENSFAGNFTLFKNSEVNRLLYQNSDNWKEILAHRNFVHSFPEQFKEKGRMVSRFAHLFSKLKKNTALIPGKKVNDLNDIVASQKSLKVKYANCMLSDEYFYQRGIKDWQIKWKNNMFVEVKTGKEALYFHFYRVKNSKNFHIPALKNLKQLEKVVITSEGIRL